MEFDDIHREKNTEFTGRLLGYKRVFYEIFEACNYTFSRGCGSYLFDGQDYKYCKSMYEKQELLYASAKQATQVLEIGTYMGHSLLIMLLANPNLKITCIDINDQFTRPAVNVLNKYFPDSIHFIHMDSLTALKTLDQTFDFFHVDGYHVHEYIRDEFTAISRLNQCPDGILRILFDDQDCMVPLQHEINANFKIVKTVIPSCAWNNVYYEIQL